MINKELLKKAKEMIDNSSRPLVLYDDDADGIACAVMLKKYKDSCYIYPVIATPEVKRLFYDVVRDQKPDLLIIVDKPLVSSEFLNLVKIPVLWIDHHPVQHPENVFYINPRMYNDSDNRAASYWVYELLESKDNLWLAALGNIADWHITNAVKLFSKENKDILPKTESIRQILHETKFGKFIDIISLDIKGGVKDVKTTVKYLLKTKDPREILERRTTEGEKLYDKYLKRLKEFNTLLRKAEDHVTDEKTLMFLYKDVKTSYTKELSNELILRYPEKIILVARIKDGWVKGSVRSTRTILPEKIKKALEGREGYGGGHNHACGIVIKEKEFELFLEAFKKLIK